MRWASTAPLDAAHLLLHCAQDEGTMEELDPQVRALVPGREVVYLGVLGPYRKSSTDDIWPTHTWAIGREPELDTPVLDLKGPTKAAKIPRKDNAIYRREVWTGSGEPVGPLDMSRVPDEMPTAFPDPLVGSDAPGPVPTPPRSVLTLQESAQEAGWVVVVTYAQGWMPHSTHGRPGSLAESWALRMTRGEQRAVVVYRGSWKSFWLWSSEIFFCQASTLAEFQGWLSFDHWSPSNGLESA